MERKRLERRTGPQWAVGILVFALTLWQVPHRYCAARASPWFGGEPRTQEALGRSVDQWVDRALDERSFATGSARFDGEWLFGTHMMAAMGFGQVAAEHPALAQHSVAQMDRCIERLLDARLRRFDTDAWGRDALASLPRRRGNAGFLGYLNLVLSLRRTLAPASPHAELNDAITEALARRVEASPSLLIETYPNEIYPVDNAAVIGSLGLHARATGTDRSALVRRWVEGANARWRDPLSGLLYQSVAADGSGPLDGARGSGTALAAYFTSFADVELSRQLYVGVRDHLGRRFLGFGAVREYPSTQSSGPGDIDSGPLVVGFSISATGFSLAGARIHDDRDWFERLFASAVLFGAPLDRGGTQRFVSGGPARQRHPVRHAHRSPFG